MSRKLRNSLILAGLETTYGSAATLAGTDAYLVSDLNAEPLRANNVPRNIIRGYMGGFEHLVGTRTKALDFSVEWAGSGTATTPPAVGRLLRACGFGETVAAASVDYTPITTFGASTSLTIDYYLDGSRHRLLGARGTVSLEARVGERPVMRFRFTGIDGGESAVANPTPDYSAFRVPLVVMDANSGDLTFGCTYVGASGTLSGGTVYPSRGIAVDVNNTVVHQPLLGGETIEITQREMTGSFSLDLTVAQEVSALTNVRANTLEALGFFHGTTTGNICGFFAPKMQRIDPRVESVNEDAHWGFNARFVPTVGNDEFRFVFR